jgi:putative flippase GtrA
MVDAASLRQMALYIAGGLLCAGIDIAVMQLLIGNGMHHSAAASAGFLSGLVVNYTYHSRLTFKQAATKSNFVRYMCVVGVNYVLTIACVALAVSLIDSPLTGKILSLPIVAVNGYLLGRYWIFK